MWQVSHLCFEALPHTQGFRAVFCASSNIPILLVGQPKMRFFVCVCVCVACRRGAVPVHVTQYSSGGSC